VTDPSTVRGSDADLVRRISVSSREQGLRIAVAESLTCGRISSLLGQGESASDWYRGAVVAYDAEIKFSVLDVDPGPTVTDMCARQMAQGARRLLHADVALGITGVGGPGSVEGCPAGTVYFAVATTQGISSAHVRISGGPSAVVAGAASMALHALDDTCEGRPAT
jgi:nicotinamide-nucleotide amidase